MVLYRRPATPLFYGLSLNCLLMFLCCCLSYGTKIDFLCLQKVHDSLQDPIGYLSNWDFNNTTEGSICKFLGIECWHEEESRVLSIKLTNMGLKGQFPLGLVNCTSLTGLYLSGNNLNDSLPSNISKIIGFVTELDLSDNEFSGQIPENLTNCKPSSEHTVSDQVCAFDSTVASGSRNLDGARIREAKSESFTFKDHRGEYPGVRHVCKKVVTHSRACSDMCSRERVYLYCSPTCQHKSGVVFNLLGQINAQEIVRESSPNWDGVISFEGLNSLLCFSLDERKSLTLQKPDLLNDCVEPSIPSPTSMFSRGYVSNAEDFSLEAVDSNLDLRFDDPLDSLLLDMDNDNQHLGFLDVDCSFQATNPSLESNPHFSALKQTVERLEDDISCKC